MPLRVTDAVLRVDGAEAEQSARLDQAQAVLVGWSARNPWARLRRVCVDRLRYVHGYDGPLDAPRLGASVQQSLRAAAASAGLLLSIACTILRDLVDP